MIETRSTKEGQWALDTEYLCEVCPNEIETLVTYWEFRVSLNYAGSFFIQIMCDKTTVSPPNYLNVEPQLSLCSSKSLYCKDVSLISVLSRCLGPLSRWSEVLEPIAS